MNPVYGTLLITGIGFAVNALFSMWFWRWRKREQVPEDIVAQFKELLKELEQRSEKRMDHLEKQGWDGEQAVWDVIDAMREQNSAIRGDIMWIKAKINGTAWKAG